MELEAELTTEYGKVCKATGIISRYDLIDQFHAGACPPDEDALCSHALTWNGVARS